VSCINSTENAVVVEVTFESERSPLLLAVYGSELSRTTEGSGSIAEFAAAVAGSYRVPIVVDGAYEGKTVSWNFESADLVSSITDEAEEAGFEMNLERDGLLRLTFN